MQKLVKENWWVKNVVNILLLLIILTRIWQDFSSATSSGVSIASFACVIGTPARIASAGLSFAFSLTTRIIKKLLKTTRNKKGSITRLSCYENLKSKALIDPKLVAKNTPQSSMKKRNTEEWKKILEWWKVKEVMLRRMNWRKMVKRIESIRQLGKTMKMHKDRRYFFTRIKMINISAVTYTKNYVHALKVNKIDNKWILWVKNALYTRQKRS